MDLHEGEVINIKRILDGQRVQKAAKSNKDKPVDSSPTHMEIMKTVVSGNTSKRNEMTEKENRGKTGEVKRQKNQKVKSVRNNKKATIVEKDCD